MAYSAQADVERAAGGADRLLQLADLDADGSIDTAALDDAIAAADEWINSYAQRQYTIPLSPVPGIIKRRSAEEAVYQLKRRRMLTTERDDAEHEERRLWLEDLARGRVSVGTDPVSPKSTAIVAATGDRSDVDKAIERDDLGGLW